jgi:cytochrome c5
VSNQFAIADKPVRARARRACGAILGLCHRPENQLLTRPNEGEKNAWAEKLARQKERSRIFADMRK